MSDPAIYFTTGNPLRDCRVGKLCRMWVWCRDSIGRFIEHRTYRVTYVSLEFVDMRASDDNTVIVTLRRKDFDASFERIA